MPRPNVGDRAPDFTLPDAGGRPVRLSGLLSKTAVVLYFYPAAFTGGCTAQACALRENYEAISRHGALIFGVSADTAASHTAFRERYDLPFPMIPDPDKRLLQLYDTLAFGGHG